jgi:hypothetical protein
MSTLLNFVCPTFSGLIATVYFLSVLASESAKFSAGFKEDGHVSIS